MIKNSYWRCSTEISGKTPSPRNAQKKLLVLWCRNNILPETYSLIQSGGGVPLAYISCSCKSICRHKPALPGGIATRGHFSATRCFGWPSVSTKARETEHLKTEHLKTIGAISDIGTVIVGSSGYMDSVLRPSAINVPSYVCNTTDFLRKIESLNNLPKNTVLAAVALESL